GPPAPSVAAKVRRWRRMTSAWVVAVMFGALCRMCGGCSSINEPRTGEVGPIFLPLLHDDLHFRCLAGLDGEVLEHLAAVLDELDVLLDPVRRAGNQPLKRDAALAVGLRLAFLKVAVAADQGDDFSR